MKSAGEKGQSFPQKIKIVEVAAFISLQLATLKSCRLLKQNTNCIRYRSNAVEAAFNKGQRLYIYDHRPEAVAAARKYKNHKRIPSFWGNTPSAKVVVMKKSPGGYYINIFPCDSNKPTTTVLKEETIESLFGEGFSISGEPSWWLVGHMDKAQVEPHGLTAVAPLHTLRRAEPSEAYPPSLKLRRIPSFIPALTGGAFSASRRRVNYIVLNDFRNTAASLSCQEIITDVG